MKVRKGFVSNSSSSSFIIAFKNKPNSVESIKKELFGDNEVFYHPYNDNIQFSVEEVCSQIKMDIKTQKPNDVKRMIDSICNGWFDGRVDRWEEYQNKESNECKKMIEEDEKENFKRAKQIVNNFLKNNKGKFIYVVNYSDNLDDLGCAMEHGDLFHNINHIVTSYH